ncbi:monosaccharide ABC transporter ATP-binding protein (CUT2 family) [Amycolatopsis sulphurea]|uniref:Monosaccharide ABC transporter ATP-binding protein (CUT2 family) n=1 Tax=Amycolatopsis sulphurea TaxID=76022 RepID=A0A2A9G1J3_9PSEU|nr:sugar ABC transporter ATP-binding protein [Amycolatopsis sulphurea]PFG56781.1 monosaccharide ABC transporter ATP-binding protein (CUT2 family) [Amycolatopsis sulphurea]
MGDGGVLVELAGVGRTYGGVRALRSVDLTVREGEVHALLGENGAGKSTLLKILSGQVAPGSGVVRIGGRPVRFTRPGHARRAGVAMIHQELDLVPALSVAENVFLGREPHTRRGTLDRPRMAARTRRVLARCGVDLDPRVPVDRLRTGEQQLVTIAKAVSLDARILLMDEPTSALSPREVDRLFAVVGQLRRDGVAIVYVSHRMDEIGRIADRATVLRNGAVVAEFAAGELTAERAAEAMVGRPVDQMFRASGGSGVGTADVLRVEDFAVRARPGRREPDGITLSVKAGEIVGLAGLLGAGRTELLEALYGASGSIPVRGRIFVRGKEFRPRSPRRALRAGLAFVPEDRRIAGLALEHSVVAGTVLSIVDRLARFGLVSARRERDAAKRAADRLGVRADSLSVPVGSLSGGNQQKVVLGRALLTEPALLLLDEPTRGVDVGAKAEIYRLLGETARTGVGVLLASSEPAELVGVCDRVVVLRDGRSVAELDTATAGEADLLAASMGEIPAGGPK